MTNKANAPPGTSAAGLRGVTAASSSISDVNGEKGELIYQGYNIHNLAKRSTFEEVIFLLWNKRLPNGAELSELEQSLRAAYEVPAELVALMKRFPRDADPIDVLRTAISALEFYDSNARDISRAASVKTAIRLTAQFPTIVAASDRIRRGLEPVRPDASLNIAANFLYMLKGEAPSERDARIFDVCLILHADHELNASTFTARVVAGTLADMYAAVTAAIGALSGPLHGGANTNVMKTLLEIGTVENVESFIKKALADKRKIMGFGHAVYRTQDPRATHLRQFSREMGEQAGESKWYEMSRKVEEVMMREKGLYPNVDFFSASTYYMMGIPLDLYTPIFAVSRISGWTGHILEQYTDNKLIRPRAEYVGPRDVAYVPIDQR
ncbi:MAG TPA: citrate synthase [Blastocatellia bacterium]|jgi:citrate synthase|nr:citrate synthase [Blastocatellia bacterium]HAF21678.1 citrate synthase [Blastocatellia bacterium]